MNLPLKGITVLEFSQYLAGPYAGLRLADLGARVIKIERPLSGDACRNLVTKNMIMDEDSLVFHTINRNKDSVTANLKAPEDLLMIKEMLKTADVMTHNFRPGVMDKIGLNYDTVKALNPLIVYGEVTGYGKEGPWKNKPGQDLLAQALSGITHLTGNAGDPPTPFGMAAADMICGTHLAQGILAALVRRGRKNIGAFVEVSLLESLIDLQFEFLTHYLNDGENLPARSAMSNAHAYVGGAYGIYPTSDGYIAVSLGSLSVLADIVDCPELKNLDTADKLYSERDRIKQLLAEKLKQAPTSEWLDQFDAAGYWGSDVYNYAKLLNHAGCRALQMEQRVKRSEDVKIMTTRCPIRIDGEKIFSEKASPALEGGRK